MWLKRWDEYRKGEDDMTVNQELDLDGRAENQGNLVRAILWTHLPFKKSAGVSHANMQVNPWPPARRTYGSERCSGLTYNHLSVTGSWESV